MEVTVAQQLRMYLAPWKLHLKTVKMVNFTSILPWIKIISFKKEKEAKAPARPVGPAPRASREDQETNGLRGRTAQISTRLPPASFPIPELFIIKELPEMECELGAQLDFVLSCFPLRGAAWFGRVGVCRALLWLVARQRQCQLPWGRLSVEHPGARAKDAHSRKSLLCPFKLA